MSYPSGIAASLSMRAEGLPGQTPTTNRHAKRILPNEPNPKFEHSAALLAAPAAEGAVPAGSAPNRFCQTNGNNILDSPFYTVYS